MRYFKENWQWIVIGITLTAQAVRESYVERGYFAYGGEWMVLPFVLFTVELVRKVRMILSEIFSSLCGKREE
mgnify:CR=1 FL=1